MLHINHKTFYATLPVRFVHTNELQLQGCLQPVIFEHGCASCAPTNYNANGDKVKLSGFRCTSRTPTNYNDFATASLKSN